MEKRFCAACGSERTERWGVHTYKCTVCGSDQMRYEHTEDRPLKFYEVVAGIIGVLLLGAFLFWIFRDRINPDADSTDWIRK